MKDEIGPDSLIEICLNQAARSIKSYESLNSLSEELTMILFHMVLSRGSLTPRVLSVSQLQSNNSWYMNWPGDFSSLCS